MLRETIAGRKSFNIVCSPVLLYRVTSTCCGFSRLEFTLANHGPSRNDLARCRLAGVSLLAGIALGGKCGLLANERSFP
jgi:hypothetical protein